MFPKLKLTEGQIRDRYAATTAADVEQALNKPRCDYFDLLALLSPAAAGMLSEMREHSQRARRIYFGKTVTVYAPLYISNSCVNSCRYCDFNREHQYARKTLTLAEIDQEAEAIASTGLDSLLIVAGEDPRRVGVDHLCAVGELLRGRFSYLSLEVAPQDEDSYRRLFDAGYRGLTLFQETYNRQLYSELHPSGPKRDFDFRVWSQLRAGRAGMRTLGMAFLLGLDEWRMEAASLGAHALYLQRECWRSKLQFAFPRITPVSDGFQPEHPVSDAELEQMMLAFRIVFPESGITISTREAPSFRDRMVVCCADNMSAGSRVTPGGYAASSDQDVGQFTLNDSRSVADVEAAIRSNGQEVVHKYWDCVL